jgi:hypothetical protein
MRKAQFWNRWILLALFTLVCFGCSTATTKFQSVWKNPSTQPLHLTTQKVVTVFIGRDPLLRRHAEEAMARALGERGVEALPSYPFLTDSEITDRDAARAKADRQGFTAAVVMRVVGSEAVYTHVSPAAIWMDPSYRHFWGGYWGWGWGRVNAPDYLVTDRIMKIETLVYSLPVDELIWAGVSRTFDQGGMERFVEELAVAVSKRMARDGLIRHI